jgi:biotin-(acetyl-CoA carboxylase) ligase
MAFNLNKELLVKVGEQNIVGSFQDLDEEGALIIKTVDGFSKINAGEVYFYD